MFPSTSVWESRLALPLCDWSISQDEDRLHSSSKLTPQISVAWPTKRACFLVALHVQCRFRDEHTALLHVLTQEPRLMVTHYLKHHLNRLTPISERFCSQPIGQNYTDAPPNRREAEKYEGSTWVFVEP